MIRLRAVEGGCLCVQLAPDLVDTSDCPVHPLLCEAIHPETGLGCVHGPGHDGQHAASITYMWPTPTSIEKPSSPPMEQI